MLGQLFVRECRQTARSLIFWLTVLILIFDFTTQLGEMEVDEEPQPGQEYYGRTITKDETLIMEKTLANLMQDLYHGSFATYPLGFYKKVTLVDEENKQVKVPKKGFPGKNALLLSASFGSSCVKFASVTSVV